MPLQKDVFLRGLQFKQQEINALTNEPDPTRAFQEMCYLFSEMLPWFAEHTGNVEVINIVEDILEDYEAIAKRVGVEVEEDE